MTQELEETELLESPKVRPARRTEQDDLTHSVKNAESPAPKAPRKSWLIRWLSLFAFAAIVAVGGVLWYSSRGYESTDDAQVEGHLDSISSRISGTVAYINPKVENNQFVEAGTLLIELDPRDYQAELEHAKANLDTASAEAHSARVTIPIVDANAINQLRAAEAERSQAVAKISEAEADLAAAQHRLQQDEALAARAERDRVRYQALVEKREISRSDYDARETQAVAAAQLVETDRSAIQSSQQRITEAQSLVGQREAQVDAARTAPQQIADAQAKSQSAGGRVEQATADVHTAQLNLSYTKIYAPVSGVVGRKTVELGHRVQPGQGLLMIVPLDDIWITANFKETQLKGMHAGQAVRIHVDSLDRDFQGKIENLPGAAGPLFSLFPPENATGNYVKVVQRFPVRIRLNNGEDPQRLLRPGMSVEPQVTIR
jgi:membrane fusion protein (multidrug efflux system)